MNLKILIRNAIVHGACEEAIKQLYTYNSFEEAAQNEDAPYYAHWYAKNVIKGRWKEGESIILKSPEWSYWYAQNVIKGRFIQGEPTILTSPHWSYHYACNVIIGRWKEYESISFNDDQYKKRYCDYFKIKE